MNRSRDGAAADATLGATTSYLLSVGSYWAGCRDQERRIRNASNLQSGAVLRPGSFSIEL